MTVRRALDRDILRLAVPALGSLIAEPIFLAVDAAMVGHLGVAELAGLGIASAVISTVVGLMVFLAYSTTPAVARRFGAGDLRGAVSVGIDGLWLALALGTVLGVAGFLAAPALVAAFAPTADVGPHAQAYLAVSMAGLPAMLLVFAATGLLRGLQDTVTPLRVAVVGFTANALLNALFIYGLGWGVAGSAAGTVVVQWGMVAAYALLIGRLARRHGASLRPHRAGLRGSARSGGWMFLRTASLRLATLATVWVATGLGTRELAGWQVVFTIFTTAAFALDALAIAAQALVGKALGEGDPDAVRAVTGRTMRWGVGAGFVAGAAIAALSGVIGLLFTGDRAMADFVQPALLVLAVSQPIAAFVFVLDGVLMGADDARYLALAGGANLLPYLPALFALAWLSPSGPGALTWLSAAFGGVFMIARGLTLGLRVRGRAWLGHV
ncbi:MATE family efflux transporter [Microbacterium oryzae]|uniref:MATE family efflux transporter n=1 Tax=Microbacterium oryzae TaxID=743009 RepID=UPI0025B1D7B1|nr:MATE family efflux transporter [Microbacterium oryzae]MDN3311320.1 MATE family efflux transporter [Microbacterium oryzae]